MVFSFLTLVNFGGYSSDNLCFGGIS